MAFNDLKRRLDAIETGPDRWPKTAADMTDEELIDHLGLSAQWPTWTEAERDHALEAIVTGGAP